MWWSSVITKFLDLCILQIWTLKLFRTSVEGVSCQSPETCFQYLFAVTPQTSVGIMLVLNWGGTHCRKPKSTTLHNFCAHFSKRCTFVANRCLHWNLDETKTMERSGFVNRTNEQNAWNQFEQFCLNSSALFVQYYADFFNWCFTR